MPDNASSTVRLAAAQMQARRVASVADWQRLVREAANQAATIDADLVVLPEYLGGLLLTLPEVKGLKPHEQIRAIAPKHVEAAEALVASAEEHSLTIVGGSGPKLRSDGSLANACPIAVPGQPLLWQEKLHITPWERDIWGITGGDQLRPIDTPCGKLGVLVCYDVEFPEAARALVDAGAEMLAVPYCTEDEAGHHRVTLCARARAVELQVPVVTTGLWGDRPEVVGLETQWAQSGIYAPCDEGLPADGILSHTLPNADALAIAEVDLGQLQHLRECGNTQPHRDRRPDLFPFSSRVHD